MNRKYRCVYVTYDKRISTLSPSPRLAPSTSTFNPHRNVLARAFPPPISLLQLFLPSPILFCPPHATHLTTSRSTTNTTRISPNTPHPMTIAKSRTCMKPAAHGSRSATASDPFAAGATRKVVYVSFLAQALAAKLLRPNRQTRELLGLGVRKWSRAVRKWKK